MTTWLPRWFACLVLLLPFVEVLAFVACLLIEDQLIGGRGHPN